MYQGVVHQVGHGVIELLQDGLVDERVTAFHHQAGLLARFDGEIPNGAGQAVGNLREGHHARPVQALLQLGGHLPELAGDLLCLIHGKLDVGGGLAHPHDELNDLLGQSVEGRKLVHLQLVELLAGGMAAPASGGSLAISTEAHRYRAAIG